MLDFDWFVEKYFKRGKKLLHGRFKSGSNTGQSKLIADRGFRDRIFSKEPHKQI
jgi:hypothetical protein